MILAIPMKIILITYWRGFAAFDMIITPYLKWESIANLIENNGIRHGEKWNLNIFISITYAWILYII